MGRCRIIILAAALLTVVWPLAGAEVARTNKSSQPEFDYTDYSTVLKQFVDNKGMVHYKGLKKDRSKLDSFVESLAGTSTETYEKWNEKQKISFWINAYNALTLRAIIDNYPIKSSFFASLQYPKNSIRQIDGVWDKRKFTVMGKKMSLNDIEHKILRKEFAEPRIHMALVCAAIGCPPLRNEAFIASKLDIQLDDQGRKFMANKKKFKLEKETVYLSPIFKWFADDFAKQKGSANANLKFVSHYLSTQDKQQLEQGSHKVKYLDYDWSLNERKTPVDNQKVKQK